MAWMHCSPQSTAHFKVVTHSKLWHAIQTAPRRARMDDVPLSDYFEVCMTKYLPLNTADACPSSPWDLDHRVLDLDVCSRFDCSALSTNTCLPLTLRALPVVRHADALIDSATATNREKRGIPLRRFCVPVGGAWILRCYIP
jgi:hypothetical protein